jgi:hypothetical protein
LKVKSEFSPKGNKLRKLKKVSSANDGAFFLLIC